MTAQLIESPSAIGGTPDRGKRRAWVLAAASAASFMVALDLLVVTTSLDTIRRDFDMPTGSLQWIVTAYGVSFAALLLTGAALGDRFGRRRMMSIGLAVFALGSAGAALAPGIGLLIASRVLQGVGGAIVLPVGLTIVASAFPSNRRGTAIGVLEGVTGLAVIAGPVVGGAVSHWLPWQWIFWINVPVALVAMLVLHAVVEETFGPDRTIDLAGLVLVSIAATATVWSLARGNTIGWASVESIAVLAIGLVSAIGFVVWERRAPAPMLPRRLFASHRFPLGVATAFFVAASLYVAVFFMAQYLQSELGVDSLGAGLRLLPWTATLFVTAPLAGGLADRVGYRTVLSFGLFAQTIGMSWLAIIAGGSPSYANLVLPLIVTGIGTSAALPVTQAAIIGAVAERDIGKAAGVNNMFQELGGAFGVALGVAAFSASGGQPTAPRVADGFVAAMTVAAALAAVAFCFSLSISRSERL
jgi:EmrB/QacA subfamily drug resistance transporter